MEPQVLLEVLDGTACPGCQVKKETWALWDLQDLQEDQEAQEDLALLDLKVNLDSQAEMAHLAFLVSKERKVTPVSRDLQETANQQWP